MSELSKVALQVDSNQSFPNNNNGYITPAILRSYNTNVIDSTVNQTQYTTDSGSWNSKIGILNGQTGSYVTTGSNTFTGNQRIIGQVSASTFVGDGSGITNVNQSPILSLNAYTQSQDTKNVTLATYTGSMNTYTQSNDTKWTAIAVYTASFSSSDALFNAYTQSTDTKFSTLGTYTGSVDTKFTTIGAYTQSQDTKNITLAAYTASITTEVNRLAASSASQATKNLTLATYTASLDTKNSTLGTYTASVDTKFVAVGSSTGSLNSYTASQDTKNVTLGTYTGSIDTKFTTLGTYTGSVDTKFTTLSSSTASLNTYTASLITAFTASGTTITVNGTTTLKSNLFVTGGVYQNVVSQSIVASTASLDLSAGTYFTLTLANNTTTHIIPTNLAAGVSATLVITTGTNSTASLAPLCLQPTGNAYTATSGSGRIDVLSLTSTNTSSMFVISAKNMI